MASGITQQDVWNAADALLREGARPTIERVRQKLGRGSPNTVSPHLDGWFRGLGARIQHATGFGGNGSIQGTTTSQGQALPAGVADAAMQVWQSAQEAARAELAEDRAREMGELQAQREHLDKERQQLRRQAEHLQARERDLQESLALLKSQLHAAQARADGLAAEQQATLKQLAEMMALAREARQAHDRLAAQMQAEREAHLAERARADERARAQEARWLKELDMAREATKRLQQQHERTSREAQNRLQETSQALLEARQAAAQAEAARVDLRNELMLMERDVGQVRAELLHVSASSDAKTEHLAALRDQLEQSRQANERAYALHASRESEWEEQMALLRSELQVAQQALAQAKSRAPSQTRKRAVQT